MEQNHELPSSFQQTERCFYVCCSGCGRIAFRHRYSPNTLFRAYFPFYQYDAKLLTVQSHRGEYDGYRCTQPVAAYIAAEEAKDADALSRCFTEDGTVHDEGRGYNGRDSISQWKEAADVNYDHVLE